MAFGFEGLATYSEIPIWILVIAITWSLIWKGLALWKSARKRHMIWFVIFILVHTLGILEILYYYLFSELRFDENAGKKRGVKKKPKKKPKKKTKKQ